MVQTTCTKCGSSFEITPEDLSFYEKVSPVLNEIRYTFPPPELCSDCRMQHRLCFRNERKFYKRKCDLTGKDIISIYAPEKDLVVYDQEAWWSDKWSPLDYGRDYDFNRSFFEQFHDLWKVTPLIALWNFNCENATFNNNCFNLKNGYMNYNCDESERLYYCYNTEFSNDCADTSFMHKSELCYECMDCTQAYGCIHCNLLDNCSDCYFCSDLIGCTKCFGCHGLRQQTHCIFNEKVTEEKWNSFIQDFNFTSDSIEKYKIRSEEARLKIPHIYTKQVQCENCTGNFLYKSKDCENCFDINGCEHIKNCIYLPWDVKYSQDCYAHGGSELTYEVMAGGVGVLHCAFINGLVNGVNDCFYSAIIGNGAEHLFGCISMMKQQYCILNKQYSKEEYFEMIPRIVEHMKSTQYQSSAAADSGTGQAGEYGKFFPVSISPFDYNETLAHDLFPLSKYEALSKGFTWRDVPDDPIESEKVIPAEKLPDKIKDIPDDVLNWAIECQATGKQFMIVPQELAFYRRMQLPIPHFHPEERYKRRMSKRPPRKLWKRHCDKCGEEMETSYAPERSEVVYCEKCYLADVY
ncbi:hypothetical protein KJ652_07190 [Patescibacteria group bacterium]|nr:hypothetical protein [Patescibacteria group bacterium]MBU1124334.1 hypothetical protein [Patescibacteria group bacterium]